MEILTAGCEWLGPTYVWFKCCGTLGKLGGKRKKHFVRKHFVDHRLKSCYMKPVFYKWLFEGLTVVHLD